MKISERNQPILKALRSKDFIENIDFDDNFGYADLILCQKMIDTFPLNYYSENFLKAYNSSCDSFSNEKLWQSFEKGDGDFILTKEKVTICFVVVSKLQNSIKLLFQHFYENQLTVSGAYFINISKNNLGFNFEGSVYGGFNAEYISKITIEVRAFLTLQLFKKYAPIEEKLVKKGTKSKLGLVKKAVNNSKYDINYIDCSWFTKIVRLEGFKVRGHFRLQPYKDKNGKWTKKLIYINEFKKNGYIRNAKKTEQ